MERALDLPPLLAMAAEEARRLGFSGDVRIDAAAGVLQFADFGAMEIPPPVMERLHGKTIEQQRSIMSGVVSRFLRSKAPPLDDRYGTLTDAEVRAGLEEGSAVVLHPPDTLADGAPVTARR